VRALSHLPPRFSLYLLGDGAEKEELMRLASLLGVSERVHFLGFKEDTRIFFHALDAHVSCSLGSETASLSLAEGMSAGCPTFASRIEGNLLRVGRGGVFFSPGDENALAKALLSLRSFEVRKKMRRAALRRAKELPSEEEARGNFEALLLSLLQK
jgi:glycosyltransferase involved in cell wall biosynthesis